MATLWLTYAWTDNDNDDIDFIIQELRAGGLTVLFDRVHIIPGQRLWDQIDAGIMAPEVDAWAIFLTENSLKSEPCQEELAYALDRALRTKGGDFPLIGIFPNPMDRAYIPSSIATRLYVNMQSPDWKDRILDGVFKRRPAGPARKINPVVVTAHNWGRFACFEFRPRAGRWYEAYIAIPKSDETKIVGLEVGPRGGPRSAFQSRRAGYEYPDSNWVMEAISDAATPENSLYVAFTGAVPRKVRVGSVQDRLEYELDLTRYSNFQAT